ncbi:MAG: phosphatidate cytidylyltransferase [Candidatus Omnitrophica bacterium]|nr:phosphatidate cytidylyltransferase [Candidatus Omnitrophota bacterium]
MSSAIILTLAGIIIFYFPNWVFSLLASAMIGCGLLEFFSLAEKKGIFVYKYFGIFVGMLVPIILYFQLGNEGFFEMEPLFIVIACLFTFVLLFIRRENSQALSSVAVTMFGLLYIAWFFSFFVKIKFLPHGALLVSFLILVTKMGDVGAYFVGRSIGKHALIPRISPNKTIEGTIGGFISSVLTALLCKTFLPDISFTHLLTLGVLLAILAQVGDLAESLIKRDCAVKDAGNNISGFGGILDIIDSLLFTTPIFYLYVKAIVK